MTLKKATLLTIIGVGLGAITTSVHPWLFKHLMHERGMSQSAMNFYLLPLGTLSNLLTNGSLILFLSTLYFKQQMNLRQATLIAIVLITISFLLGLLSTYQILQPSLGISTLITLTRTLGLLVFFVTLYIKQPKQ